ncbi:unnamed protein product [Paramecium pentaurelia]|uniref:Cache domain-containing protein n=1 Tax=Paramecium pentaurelia TaxID=43138 RepID=A0A8S1TXP1_9CILI|nr:unnamed protein product [Paramecium pentaurelia]
MIKHRRLFTFCLNNLKLRTQLIILVSLIIIVIVSYVLSVNLIHYSLFKQYFSLISNQIFEDNSFKISEKSIRSYQGYFDRVFYLNGNSLVSFHRLYHMTKKQVKQHSLELNTDYQMFYGGINKIPDPIRIIKGYGNSDISYSCMCFSNITEFQNPLSLDELIGMKIQEQTQAYASILYQGNILSQSFFYSYIIKEKTNAVYPCLNRGKGIYNYDPEKREWFVEVRHNFNKKQPYTEYSQSFTQPYLLFTDKKIGLSLVLPIVDENLELIGGVGTNFLGAQIVQIIKSQEFGFQVIYLVSDSGIMIMHPYEVGVEQLPLYIYNQSITGFNTSDWERMNSNKQSQNDSLTCPYLHKHSLSLNCLYNSLYQQEMIIGIQEIPGYSMKLIMLLSSQEYFQFYQHFQEDLDKKLLNQLWLHISILLGLFLFICCLLYIFTYTLFYPIQQIQALTINRIFSKNKKKLQMPFYANKFMSKQITLLCKSFQFVQDKLEQLSFNKTKSCRDLENYQYPQKKFSLKKYISKEDNFNKQSNLYKEQKLNANETLTQEMIIMMLRNSQKFSG